jgi:hypothetical protein
VRLRWERTSRVPRFPAWALVLVSAWLLLVAAGVLLEQRGAGALETCVLHRLTGHPCPTCGSTRVVLGLARGAWLDALRLNPLVALGLILGGTWLGARLVSGRSLTLNATARERQVLLALGLVALLANWAWVLSSQA